MLEQLATYIQGDHKVREKIPQVFQAFSRAINSTFPQVIAPKSKCNNDLLMSRVIQHQFQQYNRSPTHCDQLQNSRDFVRFKPKTLLCCANIWSNWNYFVC